MVHSKAHLPQCECSALLINHMADSWPKLLILIIYSGEILDLRKSLLTAHFCSEDAHIFPLEGNSGGEGKEAWRARARYKRAAASGVD